MQELYLDFPLNDGSRICVQRNEDRFHMPNIRADGIVPNHAHEFYEMALVIKNSFRHIYQMDETTLLPGDLFLIPPHRSHMLHFTEDVYYYNCQFFIDSISAEWIEDVQSLTYDQLKEQIEDKQNPISIDRQGILHLNQDEMEKAALLLDQILLEQLNPQPDSERLKRTLLYLLIARLTRMRNQRYILNCDSKDWKEKMVQDSVRSFELGLEQDWDMSELAAKYSLSPGYFRSIFRNVTGMPPRQFLNQIRINRAVDLIQHQGFSISDAAGKIGIHDLNYFSRLCKQVTGYPPSYFRQRITL